MADVLLAVLGWGSSRCSPPALPRHILCPGGMRAALEAQARCANSAAAPGLRAAQLAFLGNHR